MSGRPHWDRQFVEVTKIWRQNRCLRHSSISIYRLWIKRFRTYCQKNKLIETEQLTLAGVRKFTRWYAGSRHIHYDTAFESARSALLAWATALQALGESLPPWVPAKSPLSPPSPLMREFSEHLRLERGNPENTIYKKIRQLTRFKAFINERGRRLHQPRLQDIDDFVMALRKRYARSTVADICSTLRRFVRFLYITGRVPADFSSSILAPKIRPHERPHKTLPWEDVQRILRGIDRSRPCGKRDYALLLMMSAYGLGSGEAIRLTLDDVDWKASTLHVMRPKTGVDVMLPLLPAVARALADYLQHGRPIHAQSRHLFVTMRAPHKQLACSTTIRHILYTHAHRAGVTAQYLGTHVLRHTHACRQMELGTQPKLIGDILGHRNPGSTSAYLRVATENLRHLSLSVPQA